MPKETIKDASGPMRSTSEQTTDGVTTGSVTIHDLAIQVGWSREAEYVQVASVDLTEESGLRTNFGWFVELDRPAINRLIRTLRRARDQAYGADE